MPNLYKCVGPQSGANSFVYIAIPSYGDICCSLLYSLWNATYALNAAKISATLAIYKGCCHIDDARNELVRDFLESNCDQLIFIDSDEGFEPLALIKIISHNMDVVAGVVPKKQDGSGFAVQTLDNAEVLSSGLIEVSSVGTGFMKISRNALEKLYSKSVKHNLNGDYLGRMPIGIIFERTFEDNTRWSGDLSFCRKWKAEGEKIFVDPSFTFEHIGEHSWFGNYKTHLALQNGNCIKTAIEAIRTNIESDDIILNALAEWNNSQFAADAEFMIASILLSREAEGGIVEFGSGLSTAFIAAASGGKKVISVDDNYEYLLKVKKLLGEHGINNVELRYCPKKNFGEYDWYDFEYADDDIGLLVCDGPVRVSGNSRHGVSSVFSKAKKALFHDANDKNIELLVKNLSNNKYALLGKNKQIAVC